MRLISWMWFWYVLIGFVMGGGAVLIWNALKNASLKLKWFEWILMVLCYMFFMLMGQTFIASFQENQPRAAWFTLIFMGIPILLMGVVLFRSLNKRKLNIKENN